MEARVGMAMGQMARVMRVRIAIRGKIMGIRETKDLAEIRHMEGLTRDMQTLKIAHSMAKSFKVLQVNSLKTKMVPILSMEVIRMAQTPSMEVNRIHLRVSTATRARCHSTQKKKFSAIKKKLMAGTILTRGPRVFKREDIKGILLSKKT